LISNLQVLRAVAALGVVIYHTNIRINGVHSDLMGVAVFFVISGFIMVYITRQSDEGFLLKRLIRIVPLYWILTVATLLWFGLGFANPPYTWPLWASLITHPLSLAHWFAGQALSMSSRETVDALLRSLTFWPTAQTPTPILAVGWTLNIEMFFYLLFALSLWGGRTAAPFISSAVLIILFCIEASGSNDSQILSTWGHDYVIFFVFGMVVFYLWTATEDIVRSHRTVAIIAALAVLIYWPISMFVYDQTKLAPYLIAPSVVLAFLLLHSAGLRVRSRFLIDLGGASYSLYLVHVPILETLRASSAAFPFLTLATPVGCAVAIALSCAAALICYHKLELPLLRFVRSHVTWARFAIRGSRAHSVLVSPSVSRVGDVAVSD
jgi:exopolysaccharide production protein ExoZ